MASSPNSSTAPAAQTTIDMLQSQIDVLTNFSARAQTLRQLPPLLLSSKPAIESFSTTMQRVLGEVQDMHKALLEKNVQEALKAAAASERKDYSGLKEGGRRESRKRRRSPTPESPRPYPSFHPKTSSLFPVHPHSSTPITLPGLPDYIREFNATHSGKATLHIWLSTPQEPRVLEVPIPILLRFIIPDTLKAFIILGHPEGSIQDDRKKGCWSTIDSGDCHSKPPHSQSDYLVFQKLSQQVAHMIQSAPRVPFQCLMEMLVTYTSLFSAACTVCNHIVLDGGFIPPVARVWHEKEGTLGTWDARHITCLQS
ncbi:hypothetical protein EW146_g5305 [Bondarzewia mesenterica]|uniref:Mediator complex subunit 27 n=1 Tax=Bondarzewia mesenterica TaxID=1095465 RepID=A0A4S4LRV6_9AGAM|nr:hypothetical protein EW146_g5305 [Bondarzewia mesenterica]